MRTAKMLPMLASAALFGSAMVFQHVNAQSQNSPNDQPTQKVEAAVNVSQLNNSLPPKTSLAEQVLGSFDVEQGVTYEESLQLMKLSNMSLSEKRDVVRLGLSDERYSKQFLIHAFCLAHALIALDPSGELSENLLQETLRPVIRSDQSSKESVAAAFELMQYLRIDDSHRFTLLMEWLNDESHNPSSLGDVLTFYALEMEGEDATALAILLVNRLVADPDQRDYAIADSMESLAKELPQEVLKPLVQRLVANCKRGQNTSVFMALASNLEPGDLVPITEKILEFLRDEQDPYVIAGHVQILGRLSEKLDVAANRPIAETLLYQLKKQRDGFPGSMLASTLADVAIKLEPSDVRPIVDAVVQRLKSEENEGTRSALVVALGRLAAKLEPGRLTAVADLIVDELGNQEGFGYDDSSKTVEAFADRLNVADRVRYATAIIDRIATEQDWVAVDHLGQAIASLLVDVDANDTQPLGTMLIRQIQAENESRDRFVSLCKILGTFAGRMPPDELLPVASLLVREINSEQDLYSREQLVDALQPIAECLTLQQRRTFVTRLVDRMVIEDDAEMLAHLAWVVAAMSSNLPDSELQPAIASLAERIKLEQTDSNLESLIGAIELLLDNFEPAAARSFAMDLVSRLSVERDGNELIMLAWLIEELSASMSPADISEARTAMFRRLENRRDGETLMQVADVIGSLAERLDSERDEAELLLASLAQAIYPDSQVSYYSFDDDGDIQQQLSGLQSILAECELQSLVDALKAPLLTEALVVDAVLGAIEEKVGRSFEAGLWAFVEWATTDPRGMSLALDLVGAGPWATFEEPAPVEFPPLRGVTFQEQGTLEIEGAVESLVVKGDVAYGTAGTSGLRLIDLSDPAKPHEVGQAKAGPYAMAVCVADDYAYVTAGPFGWPESYLRVVDISAPDDPKVVGSIDLPDYPSGVAVKDNLVYVADHSEGLRIIDVSNPRMPTEVGFLITPGFIVDVSLAGSHAILADSEVGLRAVDISAPGDPKEVGLLRTDGPCVDVCVEGDRAYAATGDGGLVIVDISNPHSLTKIATIPTELAVSVSVQHNLAVVGAGRFGFRVFDLADLENPAAYDLKVSANGVTSFFDKNALILSDVSFGGMPVGMGNQTILRLYRVIGPGDSVPNVDQQKVEK